MTKIYANGTASFVVSAAEKVAIYSDSPIKLFQQVGYPNHPSSWDLITETAAGDTYTSAAFSADTTVRVDASASPAYYATGSSPSVSTPTPDISAADATFTVNGLEAAQGGYVNVIGGTSTTSGNAGGAAKLTGGTPGATGVGGAATIAGGVGGTASGAGGAATLTGGAAQLGNTAGGVATVTGGASTGSGTGGVASVIGGAAGAATGTGGGVAVTGGAGNTTGLGGAVAITGGVGGDAAAGGAVTITGGAAGGGNTNGGQITLTPGALAGTGVSGFIRNAGPVVNKQANPGAMTTTRALTGAEVLGGIMVATHGATGADVSIQVPTGTDLKAAMGTVVAGDSIDLTIINVSAAAADTYTLTVNTDITIVGQALIYGVHAAVFGCGSATFRFRWTTGTTFIAYRIA